MARRNNQSQWEDQKETIDALESQENPVSSPIDFDVWFSLLRDSNPKFQEWQRLQLKAFMRSKGLSERENKASYEKAFEQF